MTDDLGLESRLLVDAARDGLGPDEVAVRRMRARIAAAVAGGAVGIAAAHAASAATASAGASGGAAVSGAASSAVATKLVVAAIGLAIAAGTGAGIYAITARTTVPAATAIAAREDMPRASTSPAASHRDAPLSLAVPAPAVRREPPADSHADAMRSAPAHAAAPRIAAPAVLPHHAPRALSLARETQLLGEAESALSGGRLADAIAAVARYDAETAGRGQLAEDAAAIDVEARCKSGAPNAAEALARFTARWPGSHESARLAAACER